MRGRKSITKILLTTYIIITNASQAVLTCLIIKPNRNFASN